MTLGFGVLRREEAPGLTNVARGSNLEAGSVGVSSVLTSAAVKG